MRFANTIPLLMLAMTGHALEKSEVVGTWLLEEANETGRSRTEAYFNPDGTEETRMAASFLGTAYQATLRGEWKIQDGLLWSRATSGWESEDGQPAQPMVLEDTALHQGDAGIIPGSPRTLRIRICDGGFCFNQDYKFVSTARAFTLPAIGPGTSIHPIHRLTGEAGAGMDGTAGGRFRFRSAQGGPLYDLRGRQAPGSR